MVFGSRKNIHFIAVGGAIMHNLAICLSEQGHDVTGSDDIIFDPSLSRLKAAGLSPKEFGWFPDKITEQIDIVVLGKHARLDNPELIKAQKIGLKIHSFPSLIGELASDKFKIVIAGSHGKTTTSSMIMHCMSYHRLPHDYLVGAHLEGYRNMVQVSDAEIMVIEGDEYLSSAIDDRPKFLHYNPDILVITGIEWDHINVFKTFEDYVDQFSKLIESCDSMTEIFVDINDKELNNLIKQFPDRKIMTYAPFSWDNNKVEFNGEEFPLEIFGTHNMSNMMAAFNVCQTQGMSAGQFLLAMQSFKGAAKRQELIFENNSYSMYWDFAHAPSKVRATVKAFTEKFKGQKLSVIVELHTFSSLNESFTSLYADTLDGADAAAIFYDKENLEIKKMKPLKSQHLKEGFNRSDLVICDDKASIYNYLACQLKEFKGVMLIMSSGQLGGVNLLEIAREES